MSRLKYSRFRWSTLVSGALAVCVLGGASAYAQSIDQGDDTGSGYRIGEKSAVNADVKSNLDQTAPPTNNPQVTDPKQQGPVRMARFAYLNGNVTWRAGDGKDWSKATLNLPLQQSTQIWVADGGRADIQFDDGSALRLGNGALVTLKLLYSDAQGEFTQITMTDGLATLHALHDASVYQVDTPLVSVKAKGPSQIRFGIDSGTEVAVQRGDATVEGAQGKATLKEGDYLDLANGDAAYKPHALPAADSWDNWNTERNRLIDSKSETDRHVPPNIGLVAGDLDQYGTWREDPKYGWVWVPHVSSPDWRPYHDGSWTWVEPYGWTWVGAEPWGWAPYHYGTWVDQPYGWAWCPGPASQYWCPAVVGFSVYAGNIGWAPLCPWEVRYPAAFSLGYWGYGWGLSFSIGWAGCYYPGGFGFFVGRPWNNYYLNHFGYGHFGDGHFGDGRGGLTGNHYVPYNASHVAGASLASSAAFGGRGSYQALARGETSVFAHGQAVGAPTAGRSPFSGPSSVQPTRLSTTPTRSFASTASPSASMLNRSVYHASLPTSVQRSVPSTQAAHASSAATAAQQARTSMASSGVAGRTAAAGESRSAINSGTTRFASDRSSAAEAARQARASLGISRQSGSGSALSGGRYGTGEQAYSSGRGGYSTGSMGSRYGQTYGSGAGSFGRSGGSYSGSYHVSGSYSGGSRSGGGSFGGGGSHGGGGGGGHAR